MIRNEGTRLLERSTKTRNWNGQQPKGNPANQNCYIRGNWSPTPKQGLFKNPQHKFQYQTDKYNKYDCATPTKYQ